MLITTALKQGDRVLALNLIHQAYPYQINQRDENGQTPLHLAVQKHDIAIIEALLHKGADVNLKASDPCYKDMTPLHYAALTGDLSAAKILLKWGANTQTLNGQHLSPAMLAYQHGFGSIRDLIENHPKNHTKSETAKLINKKTLEIRNSSIEALETRHWLNEKMPQNDNVVYISEFRKKRKR